MIRVIIADDEPSVRELVAMMLDQDGYEVIQAQNGDEALAAARAREPQVVLLDVMMPGRDGIQVCRELKEDPRTAHIPVVLLTARAGFDDRVAGEQAGADAYVSKPFSPFALIRTIEHLVEVSRAVRETT